MRSRGSLTMFDDIWVFATSRWRANSLLRILLIASSSWLASVPAASPASAAPVSPQGSGDATPRLRETTAPPEERLGVLAQGTGIPVGKRVPDLHGRDLDGADVALSSLYAKGPLLIAFYRGGWCPYCNSEIHALTTAYPEYRKRGVTPVAISVDKPEAEARMKATYRIPFPVLSDTTATIIEAFRVARKVEGPELVRMKNFGVDLEGYSGSRHHEIAIPALFLVDRRGVVRWAHTDPDFKVRPSTAQILAAIDGARLADR